MSRIKVFIVEDDPDWIKAMTAYLNKEDDMLVIGAATSREEAVRLAGTLEFDVALMDICLTPGRLDGIYAVMELLDARQAKVIMLTSLEDEAVITQAFTAGAVQYVVKTDYRTLPQTIRGALRSNNPMDVLLKEFARLKRQEQLQPLTGAERELFDLLEEGYSQPQIGRKLFKAESTLKNQVNKMLKKLRVKSSKEAVEKVRRGGLMPEPSDREETGGGDGIGKDGEG
ncbi:response regulator transcription factor [Paenibacillus mesophilus]|uniref:response regulator transcription factor n=1 Tax=Paenibacillus mesophilus TaxID=2582849 RepID=UPI00110F19EC|nr:response regulator transcription factor [Paenibacillus mesophilus]TMV50773.1 response regulator transcription factor [Paenibacillus mesophilus]